MNPISNQLFSHDSIKYIYQYLDAIPMSPNYLPKKPFKLEAPEKAKKSKKDVGKEKEQNKSKENKKPSIFDL